MAVEVASALCTTLMIGLLTAHWCLWASKNLPSKPVLHQIYAGIEGIVGPKDKLASREVERQLVWIRTRNAQIAAQIAVHVVPATMLIAVVSQIVFLARSSPSSPSSSWLYVAMVLALATIYAGAVAVNRHQAQAAQATMEAVNKMYAACWLFILFISVVADEEVLNSYWFVPCILLARLTLLIVMQNARWGVPMEFLSAFMVGVRVFYLYSHFPDSGASLTHVTCQFPVSAAIMSWAAIMWERQPGIDRHAFFLLQRGFSALVDSLCDAQVRLGPDLCIKDASPQFAHLLGWSTVAEALDGTPLLDHVAPADRERVVRVLRENVAEEDDGGMPPPACVHLDLLGPTGRCIPVKLYHVSVYDMMKGAQEHLIGLQLVGLPSPEELLAAAASSSVPSCAAATAPAAAQGEQGYTALFEAMRKGREETNENSVRWQGTISAPSNSSAHSWNSDGSSSAHGDETGALKGLSGSTLEEVTVTFDLFEEGWPIRRLSIVPHLSNPSLSSWVRHEDWPAFMTAVQEHVNSSHTAEKERSLGPSFWRWPPWASNPRYGLRAEHSELLVPERHLGRIRSQLGGTREDLECEAEDEDEEEETEEESRASELSKSRAIDEPLLITLKLRGASCLKLTWPRSTASLAPIDEA